MKQKVRSLRMRYHRKSPFRRKKSVTPFLNPHDEDEDVIAGPIIYIAGLIFVAATMIVAFGAYHTGKHLAKYTIHRSEEHTSELQSH